MGVRDAIEGDATSDRVLGRTRAEELRERIEEDVATGALPPGTRLDEAELATRFGVSRTPIREALFQLASVGILEIRPRRGAIVPELSLRQIVEMFEVMAELEAMCGRLAARRMSEPEHRELVRAHEACEAARNVEDSDGYYYQNEIFHHVIYAGSHNAFLAELVSQQHRRLRPYRRLQLRVRGRIANSYNEHKKVVEAILAGDSELSAESLRTHVLVQGERFADMVALLQPLQLDSVVRGSPTGT